MAETVIEKLEKLLTKINSVSGQVLSLTKRIKTLEDVEKEIFNPDNAFLNYVKGYMFGDSTPWIKSEEEDSEEEEETKEGDIVEIPNATLEKIDKVLNGDS